MGDPVYIPAFVISQRGRSITKEKRKDMMDLLKFIPRIRHNFYENLRADELFRINYFPVNA